MSAKLCWFLALAWYKVNLLRKDQDLLDTDVNRCNVESTGTTSHSPLDSPDTIHNLLVFSCTMAIWWGVRIRMWTPIPSLLWTFHSQRPNAVPSLLCLLRLRLGFIEKRSGFIRKDQDLLESTQKFAGKFITRKWDKGYDELLNMTNLPSLADRRLYYVSCTKLCTTGLIFHLILLYLKSLDRTQALLLTCTSPLHILIVFTLWTHA